MKSGRIDSFLAGHARRMRACRLRQQNQDPAAYRNRVNEQKTRSRLRLRTKLLLEEETRQNHQTNLQTRISNKKRQRRYRSRRSIDQINRTKIRDRKYRSMKRYAEHRSQALPMSIADEPSDNLLAHPEPKLERVTACFYQIVSRPNEHSPTLCSHS